MNARRALLTVALALGAGLMLLVGVALAETSASQASPLDVVISEIAWMGIAASGADEWIELYNNTDTTIDITGWTLVAEVYGVPSIALHGTIPPKSYYLLERSDDDSVPGVPYDDYYTGAMFNDGEDLVLRDGSSSIVDRVDCGLGWFAGHNQAGVPMARVALAESGSDPDNWDHNPRCGTATNSGGISRTCTLTVTNVGYSLDYAVYFNPWFTATATSIVHTPMEDALLALIDGATTSIDIALYGLDRQSLVDALIAAHGDGVTVRVIGDDDAAAQPSYAASYQALSDAGIDLITDAKPYIQHNKFLIVDGQIVWTGSTNFTDTGMSWNANNSVMITSTTLAGVYTIEFEEMWGGNFNSAKADNTPHLFDFSGTMLESYFSPTDLVAFEVRDELSQADHTIHFATFSWTDNLLTEQVIEQVEADVEVLGVWDQLKTGGPAEYDALCAAGARIKTENWAGKLHHKFAVIDVAGPDPVVIFGSYNWSGAGAYRNDENTLIVHDAGLAQAYYEEWQRMWSAIELERTCNPYAVHLPLVVKAEAIEPPGIRITHIEYDPPGADLEGEYVRIENLGATATDMTNWTLRDEAEHVYTFPPFALGAGAYVDVWVKAGTNSATDLYWGRGSAVWTNAGDCAYLRDAADALIDTYCYS